MGVNDFRGMFGPWRERRGTQPKTFAFQRRSPKGLWKEMEGHPGCGFSLLVQVSQWPLWYWFLMRFSSSMKIPGHQRIGETHVRGAPLDAMQPAAHQEPDPVKAFDSILF
jgi:hypothetical protein